MSLLTIALAAAAVAASPVLDAAPNTRLDADVRCQLGTYALPAGRFVTITGHAGRPRDLQYTLSTGPFETLRAQADGAYASKALSIAFEPCGAGRLKLTQARTVQQGVRVPMVETQTTFTSGGVKLHGKLVMASGRPPRAMAVWIDGSNNDPSTDDAVWPYELARRGVAVFVYDKRGTGASEGDLSADFHVRAQDTAAAVLEARRLAPGVRKVGVIGASQGGWVAPLTATLTALDFVVPAFAMAESPIAQDREVVEDQLRASGAGQDDLAKARTLTAITERIVRSDLRDGFAELEAFKAAHGHEAWLKAIQPRSYTGLFLVLSTAQIKTEGPAAAQGLSFAYEPLSVIETIKPRQLWLLGGSDRQAPNARTQVLLRQVQVKRPDLGVVVFPNADHGLIEPGANGAPPVYAAGLFDIAAAWITDNRLPGQGNFLVMPTAR